MPRTILHVLPLDLPRGAQRYARALRDTLDGDTSRHRTLTLFDSSFRTLDADIKLGVGRSKLARLGFDPRVALALRGALRRTAPDAIVAHGSEPLKYLLPLVPPGTPLVYYKIGVAAPQVHRGLRRLVHASTLRRPQRVAGVSQECLDEAESMFGVPKERLVLIPNGRDPNEFRPTSEDRSRDRRPRLMFLGHFVVTKRPEWFIEAVSRLRREGLEFTASMVGDGPMLPELRGPAGQADVELLGHRDDVAALLRDHDVLAFTSVPSGEGMPGVFIEAGLSGIPVVSTDVAGARTVIADGESGYVVPHQDLPAFVARLRTLLTDTERRLRMGHAARARCVSQFTLKHSTDLWQQLLNELVTRGAA
jgi:glycosyltransferase involved in cell wall biosynthesis